MRASAPTFSCTKYKQNVLSGRKKMNDMRLEMLKMWQSSWESYVNSLNMMEKQGEKMVDMLITQSETIKDETTKIIREGMANAQEAKNSYLTAVEENFKKIEEMLSKEK